MIDLSFLRQALGSAGAGLRRQAGDHALGLLVGGGAALTVIAAGVAFAAFGGHGGGGGGGGGAGASGQSNLPRGAALPSVDGGGNGGGLSHGRGPMQLGGNDAAVAGLLQGRVPMHAQASQPQDYGANPGQSQQFGGEVGDRSFDAGARPMLAMAGNRFDPINLGVSGGYGGRAKAANANTGTGDPGGTGGTGGTESNPDPGTGTGGGGSGGEGSSGGTNPGGNSGGSDPGSNLGGGGGGGGGGTIPPEGGSTTKPLEVSPVPEPETYALMLTGLALLGWHARRRKVAAAKRPG